MSKSLVKIVRNESIDNLHKEIDGLFNSIENQIKYPKTKSPITEPMILEKLYNIRRLVSKL